MNTEGGNQDNGPDYKLKQQSLSSVVTYFVENKRSEHYYADDECPHLCQLFRCMGYDEETPSNSHLYICSQRIGDQDVSGTHSDSVGSPRSSPTGVRDVTEKFHSDDNTTTSSDLNTHETGNFFEFWVLVMGKMYVAFHKSG